MDNNEIAHDLAILYMQAQIKNDLITTPIDDNYSDFVCLYNDIKADIIDLLEKPEI